MYTPFGLLALVATEMKPPQSSVQLELLFLPFWDVVVLLKFSKNGYKSF